MDVGLDELMEVRAVHIEASPVVVAPRRRAVHPQIKFHRPLGLEHVDINHIGALPGLGMRPDVLLARRVQSRDFVRMRPRRDVELQQERRRRAPAVVEDGLVREDVVWRDELFTERRHEDRVGRADLFDDNRVPVDGIGRVLRVAQVDAVADVIRVRQQNECDATKEFRGRSADGPGQCDKYRPQQKKRAHKIAVPDQKRGDGRDKHPDARDQPLHDAGDGARARDRRREVAPLREDFVQRL
mmetsp:Transcript_20906/g.64326  ORF Transcript_20906/g.64326 Transcript_20906/m.64326 type:complete len:242 (+) Transcript_20906:224-949(+)